MKCFNNSHIKTAFVMLVFIASSASAFAQQRSADANLTLRRDLAGILGEVHYIRTLCNGNKDQYWRNYMRDFLKHEASSKQRKSLFTKAFNQGYKHRRNHLSRCDLNAAQLEVSLASRGREIAEAIAAQYMN